MPPPHRDGLCSWFLSLSLQCKQRSDELLVGEALRRDMVEPASVSTAEYAKTDAAVDSLADALADPEATADTEIDVPEALGLQEAETDTVLDKTSPTDALYGVTCTSFDDEKLGAPRRQRRGVHESASTHVRPRPQACRRCCSRGCRR